MAPAQLDDAILIQTLARRVLQLQIACALAIVTAVVALVFALTLRQSPGEAKQQLSSPGPPTESKQLRFASGDNETIITANGVVIRNGKATATVTATTVEIKAAGKGPSIELRVVPDKKNPWAAIAMSQRRIHHDFTVRVASGGNSLSLRSPNDPRRSAYMWVANSALISVKDPKRKQRIELQTGGEGLRAPQVLVEHGNRSRKISAIGVQP